jgi:probable DNA metabolism protein
MTEDLTILYDGTFEGLLSAIFEVFRLNLQPVKFSDETRHTAGLFEEVMAIETNAANAHRVYKGICKKGGASLGQDIFSAFLSEVHQVEMTIYEYLRQLFDAGASIAENYQAQPVLRVSQLAHMVGREVHRMHAFVRFQKTPDDMYVAGIKPDFNVIPLIGEHFEKRYPAQQWLIFDIKRSYGLYYDMKETQQVQLDNKAEQLLGRLPDAMLGEGEKAYQELWNQYFNAVNIPERRNLRLHIKHVPKRYWKYLPEKYLGKQ